MSSWSVFSNVDFEVGEQIDVKHSGLWHVGTVCDKKDGNILVQFDCLFLEGTNMMEPFTRDCESSNEAPSSQPLPFPQQPSSARGGLIGESPLPGGNSRSTNNKEDGLEDGENKLKLVEAVPGGGGTAGVRSYRDACISAANGNANGCMRNRKWEKVTLTKWVTNDDAHLLALAQTYTLKGKNSHQKDGHDSSLAGAHSNTITSIHSSSSPSLATRRKNSLETNESVPFFKSHASPSSSTSSTSLADASGAASSSSFSFKGRNSPSLSNSSNLDQPRHVALLRALTGDDHDEHEKGDGQDEEKQEGRGEKKGKDLLLKLFGSLDLGEETQGSSEQEHFLYLKSCLSVALDVFAKQELLRPQDEALIRKWVPGTKALLAEFKLLLEAKRSGSDIREWMKDVVQELISSEVDTPSPVAPSSVSSSVYASGTSRSSLVNLLSDKEFLFLRKLALSIKPLFDIRDRKYHLVTYKQCFVGRDACHALVKMKLAKDIPAAVALGDSLRRAGLIKHVKSAHPFKCEPLFYRFTNRILTPPPVESIPSTSGPTSTSSPLSPGSSSVAQSKEPNLYCIPLAKPLSTADNLASPSSSSACATTASSASSFASVAYKISSPLKYPLDCDIPSLITVTSSLYRPIGDDTYLNIDADADEGNESGGKDPNPLASVIPPPPSQEMTTFLSPPASVFSLFPGSPGRRRFTSSNAQLLVSSTNDAVSFSPSVLAFSNTTHLSSAKLFPSNISSSTVIASSTATVPASPTESTVTSNVTRTGKNEVYNNNNTNDIDSNDNDGDSFDDIPALAGQNDLSSSTVALLKSSTTSSSLSLPRTPTRSTPLKKQNTEPVLVGNTNNSNNNSNNNNNNNNNNNSNNNSNTSVGQNNGGGSGSNSASKRKKKRKKSVLQKHLAFDNSEEDGKQTGSTRNSHSNNSSPRSGKNRQEKEDKRDKYANGMGVSGSGNSTPVKLQISPTKSNLTAMLQQQKDLGQGRGPVSTWGDDLSSDNSAANLTSVVAPSSFSSAAAASRLERQDRQRYLSVIGHGKADQDDIAAVDSGEDEATQLSAVVVETAGKNSKDKVVDMLNNKTDRVLSKAEQEEHDERYKSVETLVSELVSPYAEQVQHRNMFLLNYSAFVTPFRLLCLLIGHYYPPGPEHTALNLEELELQYAQIEDEQRDTRFLPPPPEQTLMGKPKKKKKAVSSRDSADVASASASAQAIPFSVTASSTVLYPFTYSQVGGQHLDDDATAPSVLSGKNKASTAASSSSVHSAGTTRGGGRGGGGMSRFADIATLRVDTTKQNTREAEERRRERDDHSPASNESTPANTITDYFSVPQSDANHMNRKNNNGNGNNQHERPGSRRGEEEKEKAETELFTSFNTFAPLGNLLASPPKSQTFMKKLKNTTTTTSSSNSSSSSSNAKNIKSLAASPHSQSDRRLLSSSSSSSNTPSLATRVRAASASASCSPALHATRLKVAAVLLYWIREQYHDFHTNSPLKALLSRFLQFAQDTGGATIRLLISSVEKKEQQCMLLVAEEPDPRTPIPVLQYKHEQGYESPRANSLPPSVIDILSLDPIALVCELTLCDFRALAIIAPVELTLRAWEEKPKETNSTRKELTTTATGGSGTTSCRNNAAAFVARFNRVSHWVVHSILERDSEKQRVDVFRFFIKVAERCVQYCNFHMVFALEAAFHSAPLYRLKHLAAARVCSKPELNVLDQCQKITSDKHNYAVYRSLLEQCVAAATPCIPHLAVTFSDLYVTGVPSRYELSTQLMDINRIEKVTTAIRRICSFGTREYAYFQSITNPTLSQALTQQTFRPLTVSHAQLMKRSYELQERGK